MKLRIFKILYIFEVVPSLLKLCIFDIAPTLMKLGIFEVVPRTDETEFSRLSPSLIKLHFRGCPLTDETRDFRSCPPH